MSSAALEVYDHLDLRADPLREAEERGFRRALEMVAGKLESMRQIKAPSDFCALDDHQADEDGWREMPEEYRSIMRAAAKMVRSLQFIDD